MDTPKKSLYVETTIPSYATARASTHLIMAHRQIVTRLFWDNERHNYDLYISEFVVAECAKGDPDAAKRRLALIDGIAVLPDDENVTELAEIYFKMLNVPKRAKTDCFHLAVCVCEEIDYILTWNCAHIGEESYTSIYQYNVNHGLMTPRFFTPETLIIYEKGGYLL